jgi:hypothetical protein
MTQDRNATMTSDGNHTTGLSQRVTVKEDEEDDSWIPLVPEREGSVPTNRSQSTTVATGSSSRTLFESQNNETRHQDMKSLQRRLETRISLKNGLVDHPIGLFWRRFLIHLGRELWELDLYIRLGLSLVLTGAFLKIFLLSTWCFWYPRLVFLTAIFLVSFFYLDPFDMKRQLQAIATAIMAPEKIVDATEQLDMAQFRRLCFCFLIIPTALEMRTISFLSQIKAESGWMLYNTCLAVAICSVMMYLLKIQHWKPRDCTYKGLLVLYGSALIVTIVKTDLRRMPILAAPFFLATGTLLITYHDDDMEWLSRILRHALRLTLRDVLSSVSQKVGEDEMLQLAILRWIVDYWSYNPSRGTESSSSTRPQSESSSAQRNSSGAPVSSAGSTSSTTTLVTSSSPAPHHEVQWEELFPMLNMATDQMASEVNTLQSYEPVSGPSTEARRSQALPASRSSYSPSSSSSSSSGAPYSNSNNNNSLDNLKSMLLSLDVDERGKPAVMAYRRGVESFPPTKNVAILMSIVRRCPALLTLLWQCIFGSKSLTTALMLLLPFVILEYYRIEAWMEACDRVAQAAGDQVIGEHEEAQDTAILKNVDSMTILLSGDNHSALNPPTLLMVWRNILSSVSALEVGLTAARCAQTTTVAFDFAGNMLSLLQFGYEVSEYGLVHGLAVMAKEVIFMHTSGEAETRQQSRNPNTRYAGAAVDAVHNGHVVARNVHALMDEGVLDPLVGPLVGALCAMSGYGWLWGKEELDPVQTALPSTTETSKVGDDKLQTTSSPDDDEKLKAGSTEKPIDEEGCDTRESDKGHSVEARIASVMDLVVTTYERGLIVKVSFVNNLHVSGLSRLLFSNFAWFSLKTEKNAFCEKLVGLSEEQRLDSAITESMKRSLEALIESHANEGGYHDNWQHEMEENMTRDKVEVPVLDLVAAAYERGLIVEADLDDPTVVGEMRWTLEPMVEADPTLDPRHGADPDESKWQPLSGAPANNRAATSDLVDRMGLEPPTPRLDTTGQGRLYQGTPNLSELAPDNTVTPSSSVTPPGRGIEPSNQQTAGAASTTENIHQDEEKENDAWMKFGMAALGVVVGGVVLSMQGGGGESDRDSSERQDEGRRNISSVQIEELSDDGDDEWVSVPNTNPQ